MRGPGWPVARPGMAVGLLGGSFDPAHSGHVAITRAAMARFGLDRVWWLVSPGNPLKPDAPADLCHRVSEARRLMRHPGVVVTDLERRLRTRFTADTIADLRRRFPGVRFVWLMGSDNLAAFHRWDRWREIAETVPLGVLARPGHRLAGLTSPAARTLARARVPGACLRRCDPPAWAFASIPLREESSSRLRHEGRWQR
jgi:nicotinate-nucleotide adenylyltransferase